MPNIAGCWNINNVESKDPFQNCHTIVNYLIFAHGRERKLFGVWSDSYCFYLCVSTVKLWSEWSILSPICRRCNSTGFAIALPGKTWSQTQTESRPHSLTNHNVNVSGSDSVSQGGLYFSECKIPSHKARFYYRASHSGIVLQTLVWNRFVWCTCNTTLYIRMSEWYTYLILAMTQNSVQCVHDQIIMLMQPYIRVTLRWPLKTSDLFLPLPLAAE